MSDDLCYVYEYVDPTSNVVFYVGMGKGNRYKVHLRSGYLKDGSPKSLKILEIFKQGNEPIIRKVLENVCREEAADEERRLIALYGKENLTNRTTGRAGSPWKYGFSK